MTDTKFITTPDTHAAANGHWDVAVVNSEDGKVLHAQIQF